MNYLLWENGAPGFRTDYGQEQPSLTPFLTESKDGKKRGCVIVAPGGAYMGRAPHEGEPVARMINTVGINAFVLNYRFTPYEYPYIYYDIARAIRYVRYNAEGFGIDPEKIAILGFSAGGHLCTMGIEQFDYGMQDGDEIDKVSSRPDAGILCYPVVSLIENTHDGSRRCLLGENFDPELAAKLSGELSVRPDMPPVFMWTTAYDSYVPPENCLCLALALRKEHIPFELHIFPDGEHGLGLAESIEATAQWSPLLQKWLLGLGF